ncbi:MAG: hypothetical protein ACREKE_09195, partial [bacterium]
MKNGMLVLGFMVAGVGSLLAADTITTSATTGVSSRPQWLLNGDGVIGVRSEPSSEAGHGTADLGAGFEYVPSFIPALGFNVDYDYLAESQVTSTGRDSDLDLSLRGYFPSRGALTGWLQGGVAFNTTPNTINGRYAGFIEPGLRWVVEP